MLLVIAQANSRSWPKRLYRWYGDCKIGDSHDHVFNESKEAAKCLGFLKWYEEYFTPFDLHYLCYLY